MLPPKSAFITPVLSTAAPIADAQPRRGSGPGGPVIEYVRGLMRIAMAPVASANPNDASSAHSNAALKVLGPGMLPLLQSELAIARFSGWQWVSLPLATVVVFWCGAQFHRAALVNARHGAATMDTLISLGTLAAWGWSTVVLVGGIDGDVYFEAAAVITTLILLGRFIEVRARGRSSAD